MDEIDKKIIEMLLKDAGTPLTKIADTMGIPRPTVYLRFNKMLEEGTIKGFNLVLGTASGELKSGIFRVKNYLLSEMGSRIMKKFGEKLSKRSEVRFAAKISPEAIYVVWQGDTFDPAEFEEVVSVESVPPDIYKGI
jgi:DNA-binding Lrp family transcriptional regulator